jgi:hypothetical protein
MGPGSRFACPGRRGESAWPHLNVVASRHIVRMQPNRHCERSEAIQGPPSPRLAGLPRRSTCWLAIAKATCCSSATAPSGLFCSVSMRDLPSIEPMISRPAEDTALCSPKRGAACCSSGERWKICRNDNVEGSWKPMRDRHSHLVSSIAFRLAVFGRRGII